MLLRYGGQSPGRGYDLRWGPRQTSRLASASACLSQYLCTYDSVSGGAAWAQPHICTRDLSYTTALHRIKTRSTQTISLQREMQPADHISSQSAPKPQKAVGLSVRGFMFCIVARHSSPSVHLVPDSPPSSSSSITVHLEQADRLAHRRLYVQRLYILPVFLEQRDEEVDT